MRLAEPPIWVFYDTRVLADDGRAAGYIRIQDPGMPVDAAFVWQPDGTPVELPSNRPYFQAYARGFRSDGSAVGATRYEALGPAIPGYWTATGFHELPHLGRGGGVFFGNEELLVGTTGDTDIDGSYLPKVTVWGEDGVPRRVSGLPGTRRDETPGKMNSAGLYVGSTRDKATPSSLGRGFIAQGDEAQILSYDGFNIITARDINDGNWIVGTHTPSGAFGTYRGFLARVFTNEIYDLGLMPGYTQVFANALNNAGEVVGTASNAGGFFELALYWKPGAMEPIDLNTLVSIPGEPRLVEAMDINNAGQILTRGYNGYYILTPVPEPQAVLLGGLGVIAFATHRARRSGWTRNVH